MVDFDLEVRRKQSQTENFAFAELVVEQDSYLWDGMKTIDEVPEADQQLRTAAEITARVQQMNTKQPAPNSIPSKSN